MSDTKHTPGPWKAYRHQFGIGVLSTAVGADVAHCHGLDSLRADDEVLANAQLIAAAPELLDALICAVHSLAAALLVGHDEGLLDDEGASDENEIVNQCRAAIAKAEGR